LLSEVVSMLEPLLSAKGLTCDMTVTTGAAAMRADREKVHQIVLNLLTNAIKFTPRGGRITVEAAPCPDSPANTCVRVRDTGVGIPAGHLERVFEPFVQLVSKPAFRQDGVGLGLAISRDLARGMGGDLTATSTVAVGSTFTLVLPSV
jgi:signal transduction histidine kinase